MRPSVGHRSSDGGRFYGKVARQWRAGDAANDDGSDRAAGACPRATSLAKVRPVVPAHPTPGRESAHNPLAAFFAYGPRGPHVPFYDSPADDRGQTEILFILRDTNKTAEQVDFLF